MPLDQEKLSKKTIDELNSVAADGLNTVAKLSSGVEKMQGKIADDAKSALSDAKAAVEKAKSDVKSAESKVKEVVTNAQQSVQKSSSGGAGHHRQDPGRGRQDLGGHHQLQRHHLKRRQQGEVGSRRCGRSAD